MDDREGGIVSSTEALGGSAEEKRSGGAAAIARIIRSEYANVRKLATACPAVSSSESPLAQIPIDEPEQLRSGSDKSQKSDHGQTDGPQQSKAKQSEQSEQAGRQAQNGYALYPPINPWN